ncbi:MAG: DUF4239 domain-containing protein [Cyanobacteria bacterium SZAS LIN-3]|nr:DUF4239 domain-containing protein [Cyanobacteria bacterium SZAS LIN-3]
MTGIPVVILLSLGAAVVAMVAFVAVRKLSKPINIDEHQTFIDAMFNIVGTLVSILLGLLVASALDNYQSLEQTIDLEANAASEIFRLSRGLPSDVHDRVQILCQKYCQDVVDKEWPEMARGKISTDVFVTYAKLTETIVKFKPHDDGETNVQASLLQSVQNLGDCRRTRILALTNTKNQVLLPLLVICAVTVMLFTFLYVKHVSPLQAVLIGCVATVLGGNISVVFLLSRPFEGDWKLKPRGFELNIKTLHEVYKSGLIAPPPGTVYNTETQRLEFDQAEAVPSKAPTTTLDSNPSIYSSPMPAKAIEPVAPSASKAPASGQKP